MAVGGGGDMVPTDSRVVEVVSEDTRGGEECGRDQAVAMVEYMGGSGGLDVLCLSSRSRGCRKVRDRQ
jgi:hypothetical protein